MARQLGVPARVNVGFTAGRLAADGLSRTISAYDAHAWPELWIPNLGWTRFKPTPGSANSNPSAPSWLPLNGRGVQDPQDDRQTDEPTSRPQDATGAGGGTGTGNGGGQSDQSPESGTCAPGTHYDATTASCLDNPAVWWKRGWKYEAGALFLILLGVAPWILRALTRRRRWRIAARSTSGSVCAEIAWRELGDDMLDLHWPWPAARTPRRTVADLGADYTLSPTAMSALGMLAAAVERSRYGRTDLPKLDTLRMRTAVLIVRNELRGNAGPARRLFAVLGPASIRHHAVAQLERLWRAVSARTAALRPRGARA
jgi:hypothetical protein